MIGQLDSEATRHHIEYKRACRELDADIAEQMLALHETDLTLDYAALFLAASIRPMPEFVFHVSDPRSRDSITGNGLRAADPALGDQSTWTMGLGQPVGVYVSDESTATTGAFAHWGYPFDVWRIEQAATLPHEQDRINPRCWVIRADVSPKLVHHHATITH